MNALSETLAQLHALTGLNLQNRSLSTILRQLLASNSPEASFFLSQVLKIAGNQPELAPLQAELTLGKHLSSITQVTTFTIIHPFIKRGPKMLSLWKDEFLKERNGGMFERFNTWVSSQSPNQVIFRSLLEILVCELPAILKAQYIQPTLKEFQGYLVWLSFFEVRERSQHLAVCQAVKLIKDARLANTPDYQHRGHLMLRRVVDLLGCQQRHNGSLHMLFDPLSIREKDIEYFCNVYDYLFLELDQRYLCNIFKALTHCGLNREILFLIRMVSHILQNGQQFYTLRYLYQHFILPVLARQYKSHRKLHHEVYMLVTYYVAGFLAHCKLDQTAVDCLIEHIEFIESPGIGKEEWAELALLACKDDLHLQESTRKRLASLKMNVSEGALSKSIEKSNKVWKVTMRNGRKLKKYPEIDSTRFKGITNDTNDCYIISTIQALFITEALPALIDSLKGEQKKGKAPLLDQLRRSFQALRRKDEKQEVKGVKETGPEVFRSSRNQEDVQEYLLSLFDQLQQELAQTSSGLAYFQKLFKIETKCRYICESCGESWVKQRNEFTYIHSFRHNESFDFEARGKLEGFACRKCKKENLSQQTTIINKPKILILHINRFSHRQGVACKNLGNKPIKRQIGKYQLAGFISHRGAKISAGHYIFYGKVENGRWAIFDDKRVAEFSVEEGEEFQREFRSQNTPYILFYRLKE